MTTIRVASCCGRCKHHDEHTLRCSYWNKDMSENWYCIQFIDFVTGSEFTPIIIHLSGMIE